MSNLKSESPQEDEEQEDEKIDETVTLAKELLVRKLLKLMINK